MMNAHSVLILLSLAGTCLAQDNQGDEACGVIRCWNYFYMADLGSEELCRREAGSLATCLDQADLCGCRAGDVTQHINPDSECGDSSDQMSACESSTARACFRTAGDLMQAIHTEPPPPVVERKAAVAAFDSCIDKAKGSNESLKGCEFFFPTPGDMDYAMAYAMVRGWAQGCDNIVSLPSSCKELAKPTTINDCNGGRDPLEEAVSCLEDNAQDSPVCLDYMSGLASLLAPVKEEACLQIQQAQQKIDAACTKRTYRRELAHTFLRLLTDEE